VADFDIIIIGAGIAGASLGYELSAHCSVAVLERESVGGMHSTGRSAALFFYPYGTATMSRFALASLPFLKQPPEGFTDVPLLHPRGTIWLAREEQAAAFQALSAQFEAMDNPLEPLDCGEAIANYPILDPAYASGSMGLDRNAFDIDVHALHSAYLRGFRARGGTFLTDAEALSLQRADNCWTVNTPGGQFTAAHIVNAAGAWADQVALLAGATPASLMVTRRTMVMLPPLDIDMTDWPCFIDVAEQFYFKPEGRTLLVSPADETETEAGDVQPDELDVAITIDRLESATTLRVRSIGQRWAGLRTFAADHDPVIGWDPDVAGFFWLAGQGGAGIMTSPAIARFAASLVTGGALPDDIAGLGIRADAVSPGRFITGQ
jgi:D-arginine dehydrogenase